MRPVLWRREIDGVGTEGMLCDNNILQCFGTWDGAAIFFLSVMKTQRNEECRKNGLLCDVDNSLSVFFGGGWINRQFQVRRMGYD